MGFRSTCVASALFLTAFVPASAATVSLTPLKDNTLIQSATGSLSNGAGDIFVGRTGQPVGQSIRRGLVKFNIAGSIPNGVTITSATLTMLDVMGNNGDRTVSLHRALQDWGEGTSFQSGGMGAAATNNDATWLYTFYNAASPATSPTWTSPGGDFDPAVSASTVILGNNTGTPQFFQWSSAGMVSDIQNWLDNPSSNHGWLLQGDESVGMTAKRLRGRTNNTVPNADAPKLVVTYVPEPGAITVFILTGTCVLLMRHRRTVVAGFDR